MALTFCAGFLSLIYQVLGLFGVVPGISQDTVIEVAGMVINLLVMLGFHHPSRPATRRTVRGRCPTTNRIRRK